ncbi:hypothetical protein EDC19_0701 [Natranaerovirga hydrolytica]|uniref:Bacteriocin transport accessory protein n=1 Tax=Natranaerovirga hydrolytica TaxID=680378 RepID=A0A4V2Q1N1_9FIRM|nr:thioredoxin family protein [Natranaerovirga hydrolytica]TCK98281.1 hypothetical protein EDC19_0701 [Natranaerovirga hydrolytica]
MTEENKNNELITVIGLILSISFFLMSVYINIRNGYARDAGYYVTGFFGNGIWVLLLSSFISAIYFLVIQHIKNNLFTRVSSVIVIVILLIYGLTITIGWFHSYNELKKGSSFPNTTSITLEKLEQIIDTEDQSLIYIGRPSCPVCEYIRPYFIHYIDTENIEVFYYDTSQDRNSRPEKINEILGSINVESIPMTLCIENGTVIRAFSGKNMVANMKEYFESEEGLQFLKKIKD